MAWQKNSQNLLQFISEFEKNICVKLNWNHQMHERKNTAHVSKVEKYFYNNSH